MSISYIKFCSASTNILYTLKCDVIVKISKYLEIHIKTRMLLIHSKSSSKYKDLRLHPPIARDSFSLVYHTSIDNTGSTASGDIA